MFRKKYLNTAEEKFLAFMNVVKRVYKPKTWKPLTLIIGNIVPTHSAVTYMKANQYDSDMDVSELNPSWNTSMDLYD